MRLWCVVIDLDAGTVNFGFDREREDVLAVFSALLVSFESSDFVVSNGLNKPNFFSLFDDFLFALEPKCIRKLIF